jgi:hypothetical protein
VTRRSTNPAQHDAEPTGTGGFLGQVGLFETANGLPHGLLAIVLAIAAAVAMVPLTRLARMLDRR